MIIILLIPLLFLEVGSQCSTPNCFSCPGDICNNCTIYYTLNTVNNQCYNNTDCYPSSQCQTCETHDYAICSSCESGHYIKYDACVECIDTVRCDSCPNNTCVECKIGYTLDYDTGNCQDNYMCKSGYNCGTCATDSYDVCLTCPFIGYYMSDPGVCTICSEGDCQDCDPDDICTNCQSGFSLNDVGGCVANTNCDGGYNCETCKTDDFQKCLSCLSNFHRNSIDDTCNLGCNPSSECLDCLEGDWSECTACADDYYLFVEGDVCVECVNNCYNCTDIDVCTSCVGGFHLNNTVCEDDCEPTKNCVTDACLMEDWSLCTDCIGGYFLNGGVCVDHCNPASNCHGVYCDTSDWSVCTQCPAGKWLNEDHCNNNCDITCERCDGGASTDCVTCKTNAAEYDNSGSCTCKSGFYGEPNNCLACDLTCVTCDGPELTDCLTCFGDATLGTDGACTKNGPGNALSGAENAGIVIGVLVGVLLLLLLIFIGIFFILKRTGAFSDSKNEKAELDLSSLLSSPQEKVDDAKK